MKHADGRRGSTGAGLDGGDSEPSRYLVALRATRSREGSRRGPGEFSATGSLTCAYIHTCSCIGCVASCAFLVCVFFGCSTCRVCAQYAAGLVRRSLEMWWFVFVLMSIAYGGLCCIARRICMDARATCWEGSAGSRSGTVSVHAAVRARSARAAPQSCLALRKRSRGD